MTDVLITVGQGSPQRVNGPVVGVTMIRGIAVTIVRHNGQLRPAGPTVWKAYQAYQALEEAGKIGRTIDLKA